MKRTSIVILLLLGLVAFDFAFYSLVVKRYVNQSSAEMQAKSIELHKFLPFEQGSQIVRVSSSLKLSGDLPIISFIFLIVYLVKFIKSAKSEPERRRRIRNLLILCVFLFIIFSAVLTGFLWLLNSALAHM